MKSRKHGKIPPVPAPFILPVSILITLHRQTANHLNHSLFVTQNINYELGRFSCPYGRLRVFPIPAASCGFSTAALRSELVGAKTPSQAGLTAGCQALIWGHRPWQGAERGVASHPNPAPGQSKEL